MAETTREDREAAALACGYPFDRWPHDFHPEASAAWRERGELLRPWGAWVEMDDVAHAIAKARAEGAAAALADARRYRRLRILGCAPYGSRQLDNGSVLCFQNLDTFVDADLESHPSRGEATDEEARRG